MRKVEAGSDLTNKSGQSLAEIVASTQRVTDVIGEIAAASREQSSGIEQLNRTVAQMDGVVQQNAAQAEEMATTAQSLVEQSWNLKEATSRFNLGDREKAPVAAAPLPALRNRALPPTGPRCGAIRSRSSSKRNCAAMA